MNPNSFIVGVLFDSGDSHRLRIELDTICFGFELAQLCEESSNVRKLITSATKQIDVPGGARQRALPRSQQERALENE